MLEIPVYSPAGKKTGSVKVDEALLGGEVRPALLKQAFVAAHANRRQGTAGTKNRSRVEGSTRKLYRQKGTGNARRGAVRTNLMRGGGVAFAKVNKSWRQSMPIKMRRLANRNALLSKIIDGELKLIDDFNFKAPKTRDFAKVLGALSIDRTCLLALDPADQLTALSARNVEGVTVCRIEQLNAYDLLNHRFVLAAQQVFVSYLDGLKATRRSATADLRHAAGKEAA